MADRRREVLPFTLTEIFVLLFFALALALVWEREALERVREQTGQHDQLLAVADELGPAASNELARIMREYSEGVPDDFTELTRRMEEQGEARERVMAALVQRGADSTELSRRSMAALVDTLVQLSRQDRQQFESLVSAAGSDGSASDAIENLTAQLAQLDDRRQELANQVAYFQRARGNGLDHPPCWANDDGEIEYAFVAVLRTGTVDLRPNWPPHRQDDAEAISGMIQASGQGLSHEEFSSRARPVLSWSQAQEPQCRHFVVLVDEVAESKEAFKAGMLTVEQFFYKRLEN